MKNEHPVKLIPFNGIEIVRRGDYVVITQRQNINPVEIFIPIYLLDQVSSLLRRAV